MIYFSFYFKKTPIGSFIHSFVCLFKKWYEKFNKLIVNVNRLTKRQLNRKNE